MKEKLKLNGKTTSVFNGCGGWIETERERESFASIASALQMK